MWVCQRMYTQRGRQKQDFWKATRTAHQCKLGVRDIIP